MVNKVNKIVDGTYHVASLLFERNIFDAGFGNRLTVLYK